MTVADQLWADILPPPPELPSSLELDPEDKQLAQSVGLNPHEVQFFLSAGLDCRDDAILVHAWRNLFAAIKLKHSDRLQEYLANVSLAQERYDYHRRSWQDHCRYLVDEFHRANQVYQTFVDELTTQGLLVHSLSPVEATLLAHLKQESDTIEFKESGWFSRRRVRLIGKAPSMSPKSSWYHLVQRLRQDRSQAG